MEIINVKRSSAWRRLRKILFLLLPGALIIAGTGYGLLRLTVHVIYNSNDCDRFNIDNIELRTGTDIPALDSCQCYYDGVTQTKKAIFCLDRQQLKLLHYIEWNKFGPLPPGADSFAYHFGSVGAGPVLQPGDAPLLYRQGRHRDGNWKVLLQPSQGKLWVEVQFNGK